MKSIDMRKVCFFVLYSAAVLAAVQGCSKEHVGRVVEKGAPVEVTVSIRGTAPVSKATDVAYSDESKVKSLQIFVFNGDELEAHRMVENSLTTLIPATSGERTVFAVTNAPDIYSKLQASESDPMTLSKLLSYTTDLKDNAIDGFVMTGSVKQELVDGGNVLIDVRRIVARVSIGKISASLKDYRENYSVRINRIYLINVPGHASYDLSLDCTLWMNKLGHYDPVVDTLLFDDLTASPVFVKNNVYEKGGVKISEHEAYVPEKLLVGQYELAEGVTMTTENAYKTEHVFYSYPNKYGSNDGNSAVFSDQWAPRGSILVIDATMIEGDGTTEHPGYYPIMLPVLERNKTYSIDEVRITRLPGDVPYKPIETGESQVSISVHEWELGLNLGTISI